MPNGGSDCCGTCWFNPQSRARIGPNADPHSLRHHCEIRDLDIADPFYTYCGNHPHRSPEPDRIPIGPVWVGDGGKRTIWMPSPGTEVVRQHLLDLVARIEEQPAREYPIGIYRDELIVWQLGEFRESRAIAHLRRIAEFDAEATTGVPFHRTRTSLVKVARAALAKIESGH